jgi:hypothetical protein
LRSPSLALNLTRARAKATQPPWRESREVGSTHRGVAHCVHARAFGVGLWRGKVSLNRGVARAGEQNPHSGKGGSEYRHKLRSAAHTLRQRLRSTIFCDARGVCYFGTNAAVPPRRLARATDTTRGRGVTRAPARGRRPHPMARVAHGIVAQLRGGKLAVEAKLLLADIYRLSSGCTLRAQR